MSLVPAPSPPTASSAFCLVRRACCGGSQRKCLAGGPGLLPSAPRTSVLLPGLPTRRLPRTLADFGRRSANWPPAWHRGKRCERKRGGTQRRCFRLQRAATHAPRSEVRRSGLVPTAGPVLGAGQSGQCLLQAREEGWERGCGWANCGALPAVSGSQASPVARTTAGRSVSTATGAAGWAMVRSAGLS